MPYSSGLMVLPALYAGLSSSIVTDSTTASMALPPDFRMAYAFLAASRTPAEEVSVRSLGMLPAPPWTTTTGNIKVPQNLKTKMHKTLLLKPELAIIIYDYEYNNKYNNQFLC